MSPFTDPQYLRISQYRDSKNLASRIDLHARFSTNPLGWFTWLAAQLAIPASARILEVGCGSGQLWISQPDCLPAHAALSDFSPGMAFELREKARMWQVQPSFAVLDAADLPFFPAVFDAALANHMLYHVPDRARAIANLRRVLRPGGRLFAATNGIGHLAELYAWIARAAGLSPERTNSFGNRIIQPFTLENGETQLRDSFERVEMRVYADSLAVTEVEPLVRYTRSMMGVLAETLNETVIAKLSALWQAEIEQTGAVHISKRSGLFIAS